MNETIDLLSKKIDSTTNKPWHVVTANPEIVMLAKKNKKLLDIFGQVELITPDGIGIIIASKLLNQPLKERVSGYDLIMNLINEREKKAKTTTVYLLGAEKEVLKKAVKNLENNYTHLRIKGYHHGFYKEENEKSIVKEIHQCRPDLLLVAMGCPKQDFFIHKYKKVLNTKVAIGVGGTFDVISGKTKRAPLFIQKIGLEWFYRLLKNPTRIFRQFSLISFLVAIFKERKK